MGDYRLTSCITWRTVVSNWGIMFCSACSGFDPVAEAQFLS